MGFISLLALLQAAKTGKMLASGWALLLIGVFYNPAAAATECLVGCMLQDISPFDDDNEAVWDQRETCDSTTFGCEVSAVNYPGTFFRGALWAQTSGTDGSSDCSCGICDPYTSVRAVYYMDEEVSLWSRIQCYMAASEASGYDMSPCVAAVMDTGTLPCVDEVYEAPLIDQFSCDANSIDDIEPPSEFQSCIWDGDIRLAAEMFPVTTVSPNSASGTVPDSTECLVGCMLQDISPFDDDNEAVWDQRETCDSTTFGCEVSAANYPGTFFRGALWAQTSGTDGSSDCSCGICDPYTSVRAVYYMDEEVSLWSRIQCYMAASEASGYDMSPCVAAVMDTGTLPCVDEVYEAPLIDQFSCDANSIDDIEPPSEFQPCIWDGDIRLAAEMFTGAGPTIITPTPFAPSPNPISPPIGATPSPATFSTVSPGIDGVPPDETPVPTPPTPPSSGSPSPAAMAGVRNTAPPTPTSTGRVTSAPVAPNINPGSTEVTAIGEEDGTTHWYDHWWVITIITVGGLCAAVAAIIGALKWFGTSVSEIASGRRGRTGQAM